MSVLYIALPIAILLGAAAMVACVICIRNGQFSDLDSPQHRILSDDVPLSAKRDSASPPR